jgi:hypothetical protein
MLGDNGVSVVGATAADAPPTREKVNPAAPRAGTAFVPRFFFEACFTRGIVASSMHCKNVSSLAWSFYLLRMHPARLVTRANSHRRNCECIWRRPLTQRIVSASVPSIHVYLAFMFMNEVDDVHPNMMSVISRSRQPRSPTVLARAIMNERWLKAGLVNRLVEWNGRRACPCIRSAPPLFRPRTEAFQPCAATEVDPGRLSRLNAAPLP